MTAKKKRAQEFANKTEAEQAGKLAKELKAGLPDSAKYLVKSLLECYRALEEFNSTLFQVDMMQDSPLAQDSRFLMDEVMECGDKLVERYSLEPVASWENPGIVALK